MGEKLSRLLRCVIILIGVGILVYPSLSEYLSEKNGSRATASYDDSVSKMQQQEIDAELEAARAYNRALFEEGSGVASIDNTGDVDLADDYWNLLRIDDTGMMGYIRIPRLHTKIPIYHGTSEAVLQVGVGHMQGTSLPVGGENTHVVLSGHRGLPTASLFTDLDRMKIGDPFYIKVLNQTLAYQVDQILTVLPDETQPLQITEGQDYVTLVTCTPYGVNSHRLLVRGHRVPYDASVAAKAAVQDPTSWFENLPVQVRHMLVGITVIVMVLLLRKLMGWIWRNARGE